MADRPVAPHRVVRRWAVGVALLALLAFLPSLTAGFVFDDDELIVANEYVHALKWLPRAFTTHLWDVSPFAAAGDVNGAGGATLHYYRPLVTVSHLLTWVLAGRQAWPFHLTNVIAHALAAWLATRAATRWTGSALLGVAIGLVFALHPTRSENVVWIAGRMDIFMVLFGLAALEMFHRFDLRRTPASLALGIAFLVAALLSKEPATMFPFVLLADRPRSKLPLGIASVLCGGYALVRLFVLRPDDSGTVVRVFTPKAFLFTVGAYAQRAVFPWPPTMYHDAASFDPSGAPQYGWPMMAFGVVVIVATVVALKLAWTRSRPAFWLLVAAVAFLGPLLNIVFLGLRETSQDRFLYAPLLCALGAVGCLAKVPLQRVLRRRASQLAAGGLALAAIALIELRTLDFRDDETFWRAEVEHDANDPYALRMLGRAAASRGDLVAALTYFRQADRPEARRFQHAEQFTAAHFEEAGILAALLPDGRFAEVGALEAELARTVNPALVPPPAVIDGFAVGQPLPASELAKLQATKPFFWDAALLATRTGDNKAAASILAQLDATRMAASPLNGVLVLARIGQMNKARALVVSLRELSSVQTAARDYGAITARLDRADKLAAQRDGASSDVERHAFEALRLAELGAYWSALRVLANAELVQAPATSDLVVQLLVACRLDNAARSFAAQAGADDAALARMFAQLPPSVRALEPVPLTLDQVLSAAARPL